MIRQLFGVLLSLGVMVGSAGATTFGFDVPVRAGIRVSQSGIWTLAGDRLSSSYTGVEGSTLTVFEQVIDPIEERFVLAELTFQSVDLYSQGPLPTFFTITGYDEEHGATFFSRQFEVLSYRYVDHTELDTLLRSFSVPVKHLGITAIVLHGGTATVGCLNLNTPGPSCGETAVPLVPVPSSVPEVSGWIYLLLAGGLVLFVRNRGVFKNVHSGPLPKH